MGERERRGRETDVATFRKKFFLCSLAHLEKAGPLGGWAALANGAEKTGDVQNDVSTRSRTLPKLTKLDCSKKQKLFYL